MGTSDLAVPGQVDPRRWYLRTICVYKILIAVERDPMVSASDAVLAHAIADLGDATTPRLALCGFPAEILTLLPELAWKDVVAANRCPHCQAQVAIASAG
jgi:hypothetical protein